LRRAESPVASPAVLVPKSATATPSRWISTSKTSLKLDFCRFFEGR
jgi:hypothetical protein